MAEKGSSKWIMWVIGGCSGCLALVLVTMLGGFFACRGLAKQFDPANAHENALSSLDVEALPEGYEAVAAVSMGPLMRMVSLRAPATETEGARAFFFLRVFQPAQAAVQRRARFERFVENEELGAESLRDQSVQMELGDGEVLRREVMPFEDGEYHYFAQSGGGIYLQGQRIDGVSAVVFVECEGDSALRLAVWAHEPLGSEAEKPVDLAAPGTPADPEAVVAFLGYFGLCE